MQYFKNSEVAELFNVHKSTVANWIKASSQLGLQLSHDNDRAYIANTAKNLAILKGLVSKRQKFRTARFYRAIEPRGEFYDVYSDRHIINMMSELETHREIPHGYTYLNGGASLWDEYAKRLVTEPGANSLKSTAQLLESNQSNLDSLLGHHRKVNIVDLGPGNGLPVRGLLARLLQQDKLNRYIGIDISEEMLRIARHNLKAWFGDRLPFEGHTLDFSREPFRDPLLEGHFNADDPHGVMNVVLLLGGTLSNLRWPEQTLHIINDSMAPPDLLVYSKKLDSPQARRYFDFGVGPLVEPLDPKCKLLLDMLNIEESFYDVELSFDEAQNERRIHVRLKLDLSLSFRIGSAAQKIRLSKGDAILMWRAKHIDKIGVINQFAACGFHTVLANETDDHGYLLTISDLKQERR